MFTYYSRTSVGYARQQAASTPLNASEAADFQLQPYEADADGVVATTRHELNLPFEFWSTKYVPTFQEKPHLGTGFDWRFPYTTDRSSWLEILHSRMEGLPKFSNRILISTVSSTRSLMNPSSCMQTPIRTLLSCRYTIRSMTIPRNI